MADKTAKDKSKDKNTDKNMDKDKTAGTASSDRPAEMKTQSYSGTLMDASCAGSGSTSSTSSASSSSKPSATSASADRSAPSGDGQTCPVSASTTQFALKLKDGQTVKFDSVGNMRAQEAFKAHKKWNDSAAANKPVHVKATGVLNGDRLTVTSVD